MSIVDELGSNSNQVDLGLFIALVEHLLYETADLHNPSSPNGLLALKYTLHTLHKLVKAHGKSAAADLPYHTTR